MTSGCVVVIVSLHTSWTGQSKQSCDTAAYWRRCCLQSNASTKSEFSNNRPRQKRVIAVCNQYFNTEFTNIAGHLLSQLNRLSLHREKFTGLNYNPYLHFYVYF